MTDKRLEDRVKRLEDILVEICEHKARCKYPYLVDMRETLKNHGLVVAVEKKKAKGQKTLHAIAARERALLSIKKE